MNGPRIRLKVSKGSRTVPIKWWKRLEGWQAVPRDFESNGCSFSPDRWSRWLLWPACHIHDWDYHDVVKGWRGIGARMRRDARLRRNLITLIRLQGGSSIQAHRVARLYWLGVRVGGPFAWWL